MDVWHERHHDNFDMKLNDYKHTALNINQITSIKRIFELRQNRVDGK